MSLAVGSYVNCFVQATNHMLSEPVRVIAVYSTHIDVQYQNTTYSFRLNNTGQWVIPGTSCVLV